MLGILMFGAIEISLGLITFISVILSIILGKPTKPLPVLIFVLITALISSVLGIGILRRNLSCYHLLLFFSTVVILSKILIFAGIISLSGALETSIPAGVKNLISVTYHTLLILYFLRSPVRELFGEKRDVLFSLKSPFRI